MVLLITGSYFFQAREFNTKIQFIIQSFFTHTLRNNSIHKQTKLSLDIFYYFMYIHSFPFLFI